MEKDKKFNTNIFADGALAQKIGVTESIVFSKIKFWVDKHTRDNKNFIDGKYWVYNSVKDWQQNHLPFYAITTLTKVISKLEKIGILESRNLNSKKFDKTKWYTVNQEKLKEILADDSVNVSEPQCKKLINETEKNEKVQKVQPYNKLAESRIDNVLSPLVQNDEPIPVITTENTTESKNSISSILQAPTHLDTSHINSLIDMFQSNICELKKTTIAKFKALTEKFNFSLIKGVIEQCSISRVISYKGFEVALQSYVNRNCTTAEEVEIAAEKFREEKRQAYLAKKKTQNKQYSKSNNYYYKKKDSFCDYPQRDYDFPALERKLLGWDTDTNSSFDNTVTTSVENDIATFLNATYA